MRYALVFFLLLFSTAQRHREVTQNWPQPVVKAGLTDEQTAAAIGDYAKTLFDAGHFAGVVLVAKDDRVLLERALGDVTMDSKFNIGSINKVFTKRAIEQLASQGKLSLDDTIRKHLPDYPAAYADKVTIRQLLEHRGGLGTMFGPKYDAAPSKLRELSDFFEIVKDEPLQFEPGTAQRYSNSGYIVLGLIIERITGQKYRDYVQKNIFDPAGMKNAGFWAKDEKVANRVGGITKGKSNEDTLPGRPSSAGGAYMTARDLLNYFRWTKADGVGVGGGAPGVNAMVEIDNGWTVIALSKFDPPSAEAVAAGAMKIASVPARRMRQAPTAPQKTEMSGTVSVPLTDSGHFVTIEAKINGKGPFKFVVDSGAGGMMRVSPHLAETLQLEQIGEVLAGDPSGKNSERRPLLRVDTVEIGGARFSGVDASIGGRGADGVIGLHLFGGLTATIDYPKKELRLSREPLPANDPHVVPFTTERGVPQISIDLAGAPMKVDVDSGSPAFATVVKTDGLTFKEAPRVVGKGRTAVNEFEIRAAELRGDMKVAGWTATSPTIDIVDIFPHGHIGSRFLRQYALVFDMLNRRMGLMK